MALCQISSDKIAIQTDSMGGMIWHLLYSVWG